MSNQKNNTLELIKLLSSYMVVFIHITFPGKMGSAIDSLARFAVPLFFLISGFYSYGINGVKIKKRIRNILTLIIFSTLFYTICNTLILLTDSNTTGIISYFSKYTNASFFVNFLIFNIPISALHLWYLFAILYVYIIFYLITISRVNEKIIFIIASALLLLHILLGEFLSVFGIIIPIKIVRNFALMGFPFFSIGLLVKKYEDKIHNLPNYLIFIFAILGICESVISRYFFGKNELYIGSLFILFATICIFIKFSNIQYPSFLISLGGCSTYIYIFHIAISGVIKRIYLLLGINIDSYILLKISHPIIVCIVSTVFAYCITKIVEQIHKAKIKKLQKT